MTELWLLCEHGWTEPHMGQTSGFTRAMCPGSHPATVEEIVERLKEQGHSVFIDCRFHSSAIEADDEAQDV